MPENSITIDMDKNSVAVVWRDLTVFKPRPITDVYAKRNRERDIILRDISGMFRFSDLSAIMGPSGAGKSTLLQCLFGTWGKKYRGEILRNGAANKAAFITQNEEDHLYPCLSVLESIFYASRLKGAQEGDDQVVEELIDLLDLRTCRDTYVQSCSGGQKKRIAIAQELAARVKPRILFLDEPTSGLDSNASFMVLNQLRALSKKNDIAIIATIHQPSYKILALFDQLYVISKAGRCLFQNRPELLRNYLIEFEVNCPNGHNPADVVIDTAAINTFKHSQSDADSGNGDEEDNSNDSDCLPAFWRRGDKPEEDLEKTVNLGFTDENEVFKVRRLEETSKKNIECEIGSIDTDSMSPLENIREQGSKWSLRHTFYLLRRSFLHGTCREPLWLFIRTGLHCCVAILLALLYDREIGREDGCLLVYNDQYIVKGNCSDQVSLETLREETATSRNVSFLFFNLLFLMFAAIMPTVLTFPSEIKVFVNEHRNGWYSTASYYLAKTLTEFWIQLILPYLYCLFTYWATEQIGLNSISDVVPFMPGYSRFKIFAAISILASYVAQGVGFLIGSMFTTNFNISIFVATVIMLFNFLFSGFFVRLQSMGNAQWLTYFSFIRFAFESILLIIYGDSRCHDGKLTSHITSEHIMKKIEDFQKTQIFQVSDPTFAIQQQNEAIQSIQMSQTTTKVISMVMFQFELKDSDLTFNFIALAIHLIGWRLLTFLVLLVKVNPDNFLRDIEVPRATFRSLLKSFSFYLICLIVIASVSSVSMALYLLISQ